MTSRTITLFAEKRETPQAASAFVASILAHAGAIALLSFGVLYNPDVDNRVLPQRYTVRRLELHSKEAEAKPGGPVRLPSPLPPTASGADGAQGEREMARSVPGAGSAAQLLVQPNAPLRVKLQEEAPIPSVVLWMPGRRMPATIVPPARQKLSAAEVSPSLQAPNEELTLSDLGVSSTNLASQKQAVAPGATSPLVVHGPGADQVAPQTVSQALATPIPAAVMSLSQLHMNDGLITLPEVNEGSGKQNSQAPGSRSGVGAEGTPASPSGKLNGDRKAASSSSTSAAKSASPAAFAASAASGHGETDGSATRIDLPKDGQFGAVVVGSSLEEKYPETADLWAGRMAYTVYLHVGLARSWILQYSLPRTAEAAAGGSIARIEAPWPYNIVRPNLAAGAINADALMVHGFVNENGRFENLAVAFPPDFAQSQFVLAALTQWQFRPARQNGQNARVEVLLIIPEIP